MAKFITLKQTYDTKPGKEVVENCHLELSLLVTKWDLFVLDNELLKYKRHTQNAVQLLLVALQIIRKKIFEDLHCQKYSGHLGRDRVCKSFKERF